ncbi:6147_t:CDS:2 [Racocetra fulgida]|uniref:6147_t:CDS:1 n=1 Tax=Racocetra fulgida TaxID=60492 RepID=A0A9N9B7J3_9GLOM|nr:6147_t:CDS:2 [Racocetra fulgida]
MEIVQTTYKIKNFPNVYHGALCNSAVIYQKYQAITDLLEGAAILYNKVVEVVSEETMTKVIIAVEFLLCNQILILKHIVKEVSITPNNDPKDENCVGGIEFGPEEVNNDVLMPLIKTYYDKAKSFFDNISCEIIDRLE